MAFRKKANSILIENPDILIVPECEKIEKLNLSEMIQIPNSVYWYGDNPNKGLGIFTFGDYRIEQLDFHNPEFRYVIPLKIYNTQRSFFVLAVWTQKPFTNDFYVTQIWNAVNYYQEHFEQDNIVIAGDFNSNSIWDKPRKDATHTNTANLLFNKNIKSAYHHFYGIDHGKEIHMTHHLQRKIEKGYHIDYCFISNNLISKLLNVRVGDYQNWTSQSDHNPLIVEMED